MFDELLDQIGACLSSFDPQALLLNPPLTGCFQGTDPPRHLDKMLRDCTASCYG
jgi:hypothetical protein